MSDSTPSASILVRVLAVVAAVAALAAFATPFLVSADGDEPSAWLLEAIPGLAAAGGGPFSGEALLASIAVGVFATVLAATLVLAIAVAVRPWAHALRRVLRIVAIILLLGCAGAALLVLAISGQFGGRALPVSPTVILATIAGVLAVVATRPGRRAAPASYLSR